MSLKYNDIYLENLAHDFSRKILNIFEEEFLDTKKILLSQQQKEEFVARILHEEVGLIQELKNSMTSYGDLFIDFFRIPDTNDLYARWYLALLLKFDNAQKLGVKVQKLWLEYMARQGYIPVQKK